MLAALQQEVLELLVAEAVLVVGVVVLAKMALLVAVAEALAEAERTVEIVHTLPSARLPTKVNRMDVSVSGVVYSTCVCAQLDIYSYSLSLHT